VVEIVRSIVFNPELVRPIMQELDIPLLKEDEVLIKVHAAALNHRDLHLTNSSLKSPFTYGSDGSGTIESLGQSVTGWKVGDEIIINSQVSCHKCDNCVKGDHNLCIQGAALGGPSWAGAMSEYIKIPAKNITHKPSHLSFVQAAAIPMAFGTAWHALFSQAELQPGETLLIQGVGGGVALYCLQLAVKLGARVIVTSSSNEKIQAAIEMGATAGINYKNENVIEKLKEITPNGVDVSISSNGETLAESIGATKKGGKIIHYAYVGKPLEFLDIDTIMLKQLKIIGSLMHTYSEFEEAIKYISVTRFVPQISKTFKFEEFEEAFTYLKEGKQLGKIVINLIKE
jgi:zinc-binding alcohol dehydrogenase/oxidoreductase